MWYLTTTAMAGDAAQMCQVNKKTKTKKTKLLFIRNSLSTELPIRPGFQIVVSVWVIGYSILFSE